MRAQAVLNTCSTSLGPTAAEEVILSYKRVQGGFEGTSVGKKASEGESDVLTKRCKVPTASPAPLVMRPFAGLSCGRNCHELPTAMNHYRLLSKVLPTYRPHGNLLFSGCSMALLTTAVDAVAILRVLSRWFVLLGEVRLCVYPSAGTISIHLPCDYIYPYGCVSGSCSQRRTPKRTPIVTTVLLVRVAR
jgi:hypothetical protein